MLLILRIKFSEFEIINRIKPQLWLRIKEIIIQIVVNVELITHNLKSN
jgi:hypothetical protein